MAFSLRHLIRLCVFITAPLTSFSQSVAPAEVTMQFTVFSRLRPTGLCYLPTPQAEPETLRFFTQNKSEPHAYAGSSNLAFYNATDWARYAELKERAPSTVRPNPVAVASIPRGMKQALLIFIPLPEAQAHGIKFHVLSVPDDLERFPFGTLAVINVSGRGFTGRFSHQTLDMPVGRSENIAAEGALDIRLTCFEDGQWIEAGQHPVTLSPNNRVCLVLFPASSKTGFAPVIRTLIDELPLNNAREADRVLATK